MKVTVKFDTDLVPDRAKLRLLFSSEEVLTVPEPPEEIYVQQFDETCKDWQKNLEMNRLFLLAQERYCNHRLRVQGYLFLNDVYDILGFARTPVGQLVGWLHPTENGDGFIDFDTTNNDPENESITLSFNTDGVIWNKI